MTKRTYWQDWVTLLAILLVIFAGLMVTGCGRVPTTEGRAADPNYPCGPKVLIFHAEWCHWCPAFEEIVQLQKDYPGCEIIDVDIDKHPELKAEYHVTKIPRFFLCTPDGGCHTTTSFAELKGWLRAI